MPGYSLGIAGRAQRTQDSAIWPLALLPPTGLLGRKPTLRSILSRTAFLDFSMSSNSLPLYNSASFAMHSLRLWAKRLAGLFKSLSLYKITSIPQQVNLSLTLFAKLSSTLYLAARRSIILCCLQFLVYRHQEEK